ncbi:MAG: hypothetical protein IH968_01470, partial [Gemmatimonadetes bacterium]|nr:hypothetical protein [Gemmatimonadota bacterium]
MSPRAEFADLSRELAGVFSEGVDGPLTETAFNDLALRCFAYQVATNPVYEGFVRGRGASPDGVGSWKDIPAVPASGFKAVRLVSGDPGRVEKVFRTSGTTAGDTEVQDTETEELIVSVVPGADRNDRHHELEPILSAIFLSRPAAYWFEALGDTC